MKENPVSFQLFAWAMGLVFIIFGYILTMMHTLSMKVDSSTSVENEIKVQLSQIQTDILWIKIRLDKPQ